jgi:hypothetical protein
MDERHIEESSMADARDILEQLGGWPVLLEDKWEAGNFTWYGLAEKANILGFDTSRILSASKLLCFVLVYEYSSWRTNGRPSTSPGAASPKRPTSSASIPA